MSERMGEIAGFGMRSNEICCLEFQALVVLPSKLQTDMRCHCQQVCFWPHRDAEKHDDIT